MHLILSYGLLLFACSLAIVRGGVPERIVAVTYLVAVPVTVLVLAPLDDRFRGFELGSFLVDVALLVVFATVALHANRYWTLWLTAMQSASVLAYFLGLVSALGMNATRAILVQIWFYPIMVTIVVGTLRHRQRKSETGIDDSWSLFSRSTSPRPSGAPSTS